MPCYTTQHNFVSLVSTNSYKFLSRPVVKSSKFIMSPNNAAQRHVSKKRCVLWKLLSIRFSEHGKVS